MGRSCVLLHVVLLACTGCPGVNVGTTTADLIPAGVYVGVASCEDSLGAETTLQGILRTDEDGWPLTADNSRLALGAPLDLPAGGGFIIDGELTGLDMDGPKIVETWHYTATSTVDEEGKFTYILVKTSRLLPDGRVSLTLTQVGSGFDPSLNQYVTWNQTCSGTLSR